MEEKENEKVRTLNSVSLDSQEDDIEKSEVSQDRKKKKCCKFPSAYSILLILEVLVFLLLYIVPKGKYDTIEYSEGIFIIKFPNAKNLELKCYTRSSR